jgi:hypothetical protein
LKTICGRQRKRVSVSLYVINRFKIVVVHHFLPYVSSFDFI